MKAPKALIIVALSLVLTAMCAAIPSFAATATQTETYSPVLMTIVAPAGDLVAQGAQLLQADMTTDLANLTQIVTWGFGLMGTGANVFMQPPYVYFVGLGIFFMILTAAAGFIIMRRNGAKKRSK